MSNTPLISVTMVTYNQEPFIRESIRSVLSQTFPNFELVIVDDGSTDATPQAVAEFTDPRIVSIRQENQGPGGAMNTALGASRGDYIAFMTGDDLCHPDRLETQLHALRQAGGGVLFSDMDYVDESGNHLESCHFPKGFFIVPKLSQSQILKRFFQQNFIASPTGFAEASALRSTGPLDVALYQIHDFEWYLQLVKRYKFTFLHQSTFTYRVRNAGANLSAPTPAKSIRCGNEFYLVLKDFFQGMSAELFIEGFGDDFINPDSRSPDELACEQAFLFLHHRTFPLAPFIGVEKLHGLLRRPETAAVLRERFNFTQRTFAELLTKVDLVSHSAEINKGIVADYEYRLQHQRNQYEATLAETNAMRTKRENELAARENELRARLQQEYEYYRQFRFRAVDKATHHLKRLPLVYGMIRSTAIRAAKLLRGARDYLLAGEEDRSS